MCGIHITRKGSTGRERQGHLDVGPVPFPGCLAPGFGKRGSRRGTVSRGLARRISGRIWPRLFFELSTVLKSKHVVAPLSHGVEQDTGDLPTVGLWEARRPTRKQGRSCLGNEPWRIAMRGEGVLYRAADGGGFDFAAARLGARVACRPCVDRQPGAQP